MADAVTNGPGLTGKPAALDSGNDIELIGTARALKRLVQQHAQNRASEIFGHVRAIDGDPAIATLDPDTGRGILAAAGGVGTAKAVNLGFNRGCLNRL